MRVLVCGGRTYSDIVRVFCVLDKLHVNAGIDCVIQGGAKGADRLALEWAVQTNVPVKTYEADWECFGKFAGPMRNKVMLEDGKPDIVLAFPGGRGTNDMIRKARREGVEVYEISP